MTAQTVTAFAWCRKRDSKAWLEGTTVFLTLSVGSSIALVGQTYHLVDDFNNFVLVWMLLTIPLVYLMDVKSVAGMYLVGVLAWVASVQHIGLLKYAAWALMALILPYYWRLIKNDRYANSAAVLSWLLVLCFYGCFSMTWDKHLWQLLYAALFSTTYLAGVLWFDDTEKTWQKHFQIAGLLGGMGLAYFLSFKNTWAADFWFLRMSSASPGENLVAFGLVALAIGLSILLVKRGMSRSVLIGALPVVVGAGYLLQSGDRSGINASILMSLYLLGVSVSVIRKGVQETRIGLLNLGMLMMAALILIRFFDSSYCFAVRGVAFILTGLAFLSVNLVMSRRKVGVTK